jgi:hypothetical protein
MAQFVPHVSSGAYPGAYLRNRLARQRWVYAELAHRALRAEHMKFTDAVRVGAPLVIGVLVVAWEATASGAHEFSHPTRLAAAHTAA